MSTDISERVREIRKALGLTQKDLADTLGISFSALSDIERGKNGLSVELFKKLINIHSVQPLFLLNGTIPMFQGPPTGMHAKLLEPSKLNLTVDPKLKATLPGSPLVVGQRPHDRVGIDLESQISELRARLFALETAAQWSDKLNQIEAKLDALLMRLDA